MQRVLWLTCQFCLVASFLGFGLLSGCSQDQGIREYAVEEIIPATQKPSLASAISTSAPPSWFFKMTGEPDEVLRQIVPFSQVLKTLIFDVNGAPHYDSPKEWKVTEGPPPRYQTLTVPDTDPALELTVSSLPGPADHFDQYLLANINRWRSQLGLDEYTGDDWLVEARGKGEVVVIPGESRVITMVNLIGEMADQGPTRILGAVVILGPGSSDSAMSQDATGSTAPAVAAKSPLEFEAPESWSKTAGNAMRVASFDARQDAGTADVSVSRLPGGGDNLSNVNRWRGQVKLDSITQEELDSSSKEMQIDGQTALYIEAMGPEESILAAIVPDGNAKWFFKMQGPSDVVAAEIQNFEGFLNSVKFEK